MEWNWTFAYWLGGLLLLFLPMELWAAVKTPGKTDTFSEFVWWAFGIKTRAAQQQVRWARFRRLSLAGMCVSLTAHFVLGVGPAGVIIFGVPCGLIMLHAVMFERGKTMGLGSIKDTIVRKLALRWLRGKTEDLRSKDKETGMGKVLKFLDGWKLVIVTLVIFGSRVYDAAHNGHTSDIIGSVLAALGFIPAAGSTDMVAIGAAATGALAIWGVFSRAYKAQQQIRAGSSVAGALATEGYVAKAVADAQTSYVKGTELQRIVDNAEAKAIGNMKD